MAEEPDRPSAPSGPSLPSSEPVSSSAPASPRDPVSSHGPARLWSNPQTRYPILVLAYLLVIALAYQTFFESLRPALETLEAWTAAAVHHAMAVFTSATTNRGNLVTYEGFAVEIITECVGILEMMIYSACVLAFPAPIRSRVAGVVLGSLAILFFNLLRIATLLVVGRHAHDWFDFFHVYFWQGTLIAMIVGVLYGWIRLFVQR